MSAVRHCLAGIVKAPAGQAMPDQVAATSFPPARSWTRRTCARWL